MSPSYPWLEVAIGGARHRNRIVDARAFRLPVGGMDAFRSLYRFPEALAEQVRQTGSVRGYRGPVDADFLALDIDDNDLSSSLKRTRLMLEKIHARTDTDPQQLRVFFSGKKGFHVFIPPAMFSPEPSAAIPRIFLAMARVLVDDGFDPSLYDGPLRLIRLSGSRHSKSGLFKIPLTLVELRTLSAEAIVALARKPRAVAAPPVEFSPGLHAVYAEAVDAEAQSQVIPHKDADQVCLVPPCIERMLGGVDLHLRHAVALRLGAFYARRGLTGDMLEAVLRVWNGRNRPPMDEREVEVDLRRVARDAARYDYGCNDAVRLAFCKGACPYRTDWDDQRAAAAFEDMPFDLRHALATAPEMRLARPALALAKAGLPLDALRLVLAARLGPSRAASLARWVAGRMGDEHA